MHDRKCFSSYLFVSKVGDWVEVTADYSPGRCSDGGLGAIIVVHRGVEGASNNADVTLDECSSVDVKFLLTGWVEKNVPLTRLHSVPFVMKVPCSISMLVNLKLQPFFLSPSGAHFQTGSSSS